MTIEARLAVATRLIREAGDLAPEETADGYFEAHVQAWDYLAGILIVREAGGRTNEVLGPLMLARGGPLLASAPALFDRLAEVAAARLDLAGGS